MPNGGANGYADLYALCTFSSYEEERCIEMAISDASLSPVSGAASPPFRLGVLVGAFDRYDRCIEIASLVHCPLPHQGRLRRLLVSGPGGAFDRYDRCIEIGNLGCIAFSRIRGRLRRLFVSGTGGAFDRYDRCIEMAISGASLSLAPSAASPPSRLGSWWRIRPL
jgi:hypothetical protein